MSDPLPFVHADHETHTFKDANGNDLDADAVKAAIELKTIHDCSWDFAKYLEWGQSWDKLDVYYVEREAALNGT